MKIDPFGGAKPRLLRRGKEAPLRVNPEQAQAFRPGSRRVDLHCHTKYSGDNYLEPDQKDATFFALSTFFAKG